MHTVGLDLEALEDRAVPSTLTVQPPALPAVQGTASSITAYQVVTLNAQFSSWSPSAGVLAAGLDRLLVDVATPVTVASPEQIQSSVQPRTGETGVTFVLAPSTGQEARSGAVEAADLGQVPSSPTLPASDTGKVGEVVAPTPPASPASPIVARADQLIAPGPSNTSAIEYTTLLKPGTSEAAQSQAPPPGSSFAPDRVPGPAPASDDPARSGNVSATAPADLSNGVYAGQPSADLEAAAAAAQPEPAIPDDVGLDFLPDGKGAPGTVAGELFSGDRPPIDRFLARLSDGALLQRFVVYREEAAFTALVQRYDRLVYGVCQSVLGDSHAAQDAFQGTFLALARKANVLAWQHPLGGWLARVAYRLALRLREIAARRRRSEQQAAGERPSQAARESSAELEKQELRQALSEELERLPEKYRAPLVLCYLHGRTHDEAARLIGLPRGSMAKRIGEGLERLRERLQVRGFRF
jgi:RNA polymerase sigma factor (sigma-70 family)